MEKFLKIFLFGFRLVYIEDPTDRPKYDPERKSILEANTILSVTSFFYKLRYKTHKSRLSYEIKCVLCEIAQKVKKSKI